MNSYFQLVITGSGTAIRIFPSKDGGAALFVGDVRDYLDDRGIEYDLVKLNDAVSKADGAPVLLTQRQVLPERESYRLTISEDKMTASAFFYAPSVGAELMTADEVIKDLAFRKIKSGIQEEAIKAFFQNREYCREIVIAQGKKVREGHDAKIQLFFEQNLRAKPQLNEDGSVDYHNLNLINHVTKGDKLAQLFPEDPGEEGENIYGETLKPRAVKADRIPAGKNTQLSEDKLILTAASDGHVVIRESRITVSNVLTVDNVDVSTGNIDFDGSVEVKGIVAAGFAIKAAGNVEVRGIVEGAQIEADGDVILERGINGMGKGDIKAKGNVVTKFIENATVTAGGSVTSESIMHSTILSGTEVNVSGKRGFIAGGRVSARDKITAKFLGSEMGANTLIEVGADPSLKIRMKELQKMIAAEQKQMEGVKPTLDAIIKKLTAGLKLTPEQVKMAQQLQAVSKKLTADMAAQNEEYSQLQAKLAESKEAYVVVEDKAYPGTTIVIGELSMVIKKVVTYSRFVNKDGDVRIAAV